MVFHLLLCVDLMQLCYLFAFSSDFEVMLCKHFSVLWNLSSSRIDAVGIPKTAMIEKVRAN